MAGAVHWVIQSRPSVKNHFTAERDWLDTDDEPASFDDANQYLRFYARNVPMFEYRAVSRVAE